MTRLLNLLILPFLLGCTPKRDAVPVIWVKSDAEAWIYSTIKATQIGGRSYKIQPTGSMEPFLTGGDFIVADTNVPYKDVKQGWMATYQARWRPVDADPVCHWVAAAQGNEWIMDGQHNEHYESGPAYQMGEKEFRGRVILIFKVRKP